tara:strand:- start:213 stop:770 length:558 start_codon:yes stop_codon:yes gene_type:complete
VKKKILFFFFLLNISNIGYSAVEEKIVNNFINLKNFSFNFKQSIDDKTEEGKCIIQYPGKIFCEYNNLKKKIIVSNGKSVVIKHLQGNAYFLYPLEKTPLKFILNKNYLIQKIKVSKAKLFDEKYYIIKINSDNTIINIFFDKNTYDFIGWQTEDIYQNLVITFLYNLKKNFQIKEKIFKLPKPN